MATVSDVARRANVSPGVVSRLLNGDATLKIRDATRERVLAAVAELDYSPNYAARALRRARSGLVAIGVHDASNPIYTEIIHGVQSAATTAGYALMLADVDALADDDRTFKRIVSSGAIDGFLLQRAGNQSDALIERIASESVPTVLLNDRTEGTIGSVALDDYGATRLATRHLLELGHRAIGFLQVDGPKSRSELRLKGWEDALQESGISPEQAWVAVAGHDPQSGAAGMRTLLGRGGALTAVCVANSLAAVGSIAAALEFGLGVPADLSVVGIHDFELAAFLMPPLTTVRLPLERLGVDSLQMLLRQLDGGIIGHDVVMTPAPALIQRGSTAPPRDDTRPA